MNTNNPLIALATDCAGSDKARYEIAVKRCFHPLSPTVAFFGTESMNTLHAGFTAAAHALSTVDHFGPLAEGERVGILVNAAPRHGQENGRQLRGAKRKVEGEEIYALKLTNGLWVVGPNAGMNFFFVQKHRIEKSYLLTDCSGLVTPFRSMEFMIPALSKVLEVREFPNIELEPKTLTVPVPKEGIFVADWDSHGNIYIFSTVPETEWVPDIGEHVSVRIGNSVARLRHVDGIFAGHTGEPTLTTGSLKLNGRHIYYIVVVGGDAHGLFKNPPVGTRINIEMD